MDDKKEIFCLAILQSKYEDVLKIISNKEKGYNFFSIPKKDGYRKIGYLKDESFLKIYQNRLIDNFFSHYPIPVVVKGFVKDENYFSFLKEHIGSNYFLRIDIKDFFDSIKFEHFNNFMLEMASFQNKDDDIDKIIKLIWDIISYNNSLVQGTTSSPMISNLIFRRIDQRILKYCQELQIKYTRYADDLFFSSQSFDFQNKKWFLKKINHILKENDFKINYSKLKCCNKQISFNGFVVSNKNIRLSRKRFKDINQMIWFINHNISSIKKESDFFEQLHKINFTNITKYEKISSYYKLLQFLCGYRSFLIGCIKEYEMSNKTKNRISKLLKKVDKCISVIINKHYPTYSS
jgi:RNA-directed DNA polymerase